MSGKRPDRWRWISVLEGSVRWSGNRVRITAQVARRERDGAHVWAERYDRSLDNIAIQDEITLVIATEMQVKLTEGEQARLRYTTTKNVEAWTCSGGGPGFLSPVYFEGKNRPRLGTVGKRQRTRPDLCGAQRHPRLDVLPEYQFGWWDDRATALSKAHAYMALQKTRQRRRPYLLCGVVMDEWSLR